MKNRHQTLSRRVYGYSLAFLLTVIAVMAVLSALLYPKIATPEHPPMDQRPSGDDDYDIKLRAITRNFHYHKH